MPATRPVRRSQLVSPFGVGAMMDFPNDESLMPAGLDAWWAATEACPVDSDWEVREERLEARLGVTHFRQPPEHRDGGKGEKLANIDIPFIRFPRWHYCHHCGSMRKISIFSSTRERCSGPAYAQQSCSLKPEKRRPFLIPVRFVATCDSGHIEDFPFEQFVHQGNLCANPGELRMRAGRSSAGLTGIRVECTGCNASRVLGDVFQFDPAKGGPLSKIGCLCRGVRPWLGEQDSGAGCGAHLRVVQRGASNVYFPLVVSAIYLPLWAEDAGDRRLVEAVEEPRYWRMLTQGTLNGKIDIERCGIAAEILGLDPVALQEIAQKKLDGIPNPAAMTALDEEQFRQSEYDALCGARGSEETDLFVEGADLGTYEPEVSRFFSKIHMVHKLRETRVMAGFTRLYPPDGLAQGARVQPLKLSPQVGWLPAIKVYGEGLFIELDTTLVDVWIARLGDRSDLLERLSGTYNSARRKRQQSNRQVNARFVLLHTLGHLLINQLSFDCGYGSAALRERIFCNLLHPEKPMCGILIYTASGDSEGSMGGLVRMGGNGRFETTLRRAINRASWCSSDPVCIESLGQGPDSSNLAACHGCCLLPEPSCEEGNRLLDRALLIGTPDHPEIGFFHELIE